MPKRLGPKRLGPKRLGAETCRGRNGLDPKRLVTKMAKFKTLSVCQKIFFSINLLRAHVQYVCNMDANYCRDSMKALRGVCTTNHYL